MALSMAPICLTFFFAENRDVDDVMPFVVFCFVVLLCKGLENWGLINYVAPRSSDGADNSISKIDNKWRGGIVCSLCNADQEPGFYKENQMTQCSACYGRGLIAHKDGSDTICGKCNVWQLLNEVISKVMLIRDFGCCRNNYLVHTWKEKADRCVDRKHLEAIKIKVFRRLEECL